jgi:hypothetical protein
VNSKLTSEAEYQAHGVTQRNEGLRKNGSWKGGEFCAEGEVPFAEDVDEDAVEARAEDADEGVPARNSEAKGPGKED